jgi:ABC-type Fe3+ transport system permease subunit
MTFGLVAVAGFAYAIPRGSSVDLFVCVVLGVVVVLTLVGVLVKGAVSEWWANVDPNPTPPPLKPRYWPGSKADLAQKAAAKQQGREVV